MTRYKPEIWFDLSDVIGEMKLHDVSIGYDGNVYVLASTKGFIRHYENRNWFRTKQPIDYIVFIIDGERQISSFSIPAQSFIYSDVQPLPNEEILLATARSVFRSTSDYDLNGKVFTKDGVLQREFLLGDGIQTVQTTSTGMIWTSYFDEGTMGNYGWGFGTGKTMPIGANGLLKWDSFGNIKWEFDAEKLKLPPIVDCYALNVIDDDTVWIYYYSNFPIVRLKNDKVDVFWRSPISGIQLMIIEQNYIMFYKRYRFTLYKFEASKPMKKVSDHKLSPRPEWLGIRHNTFVYSNGMKIYRMTIQDMINNT